MTSALSTLVYTAIARHWLDLLGAKGYSFPPVSYVIWYVAIALEALLLYRGMKQSLLRKYPFFYSYIAINLLIDSISLVPFLRGPVFYYYFYWYSAVPLILSGYLVVIEIFGHTLQHSPGVARMARTFLIALGFFGLIVVAVHAAHSPLFSPAYTMVFMTRELTCLEGAVLLGLLWLIGRYRLPMGSNTLGIAAGYTLFVGTDVINMTLVLSFKHWSIYQVHPTMWVVASLIFCVSLWSPTPEPPPPVENDIERDYEALAAKTRVALHRTSAYLAKVSRP